jgi:hypothetical protein
MSSFMSQLIRAPSLTLEPSSLTGANAHRNFHGIQESKHGKKRLGGRKWHSFSKQEIPF